MELKFKEFDENINKEYVSNIDGLKIKPYLTIEEINDIVNQMLDTESQVDRYMIYICKLVEYCTNIDIDKSDDNSINGAEVYDMIVKNGLLSSIEENIENAYVIYDIIDKSENVYTIGRMLVENIGDILKGFDMNKIQNEFSNLSNQLKEENKK